MRSLSFAIAVALISATANAQQQPVYFEGGKTAYKTSGGEWSPARITIDSASKAITVYDAMSGMLIHTHTPATGVASSMGGPRRVMDEEENQYMKYAGAGVAGLGLLWGLPELKDYMDARDISRCGEDVGFGVTGVCPSMPWASWALAGGMIAGGAVLYTRTTEFPAFDLGGIRIRVNKGQEFIFSRAAGLALRLDSPGRHLPVPRRFSLSVAPPRNGGFAMMASVRF